MKMREDVWRDNGMRLWVTVITMKRTLKALNRRKFTLHVVDEVGKPKRFVTVF
jgi:hypothetical protein